MNADFWIMRPLSAVFWLGFALHLIGLAVVASLLRGKSLRTKQIVLVTACALTVIGFVAYKVALSMDADYRVLNESMGGFNWWNELPFHLCNVNMFLIPAAVITRKRGLLGFGFFVGALGAAMALFLPGSGFTGFPIYLPRMLGYYGTHYMIVTEALALMAFGFYRPRFRDLPLTILTLFCCALIMFGLNMLLRSTGLSPKANYFYTVETEGNAILELFYSWIPVPFLYTLPSIGILAVYVLVMTAGFEGVERIVAKWRGGKQAG